MPALTSAALRRHSVPRWAWSVVGAIVSGTLVMAEMVASFMSPPDLMAIGRPPLGSVAYLGTGLQIAAIAVPALIWVSPRIATVMAGLVYPLIPLGQASFGAAWVLSAGLAGVVLLLDLAGRAYDAARDTRVGSARNRFAPDGYDRADSPATLPAGLGWACLAAGMAVAVALLGWHQVAIADVAGFEDRAQRQIATVTSVAGGHVSLTTDSGAEYLVPDPSFSLVEGAQLLVLVDPLAQHRTVLAAELDDPSWAVGAATVAAALGLAGFAAFVVRGRRREALVAGGGVARHAVWVQQDDHHYLLPLGSDQPRRRLLDLDVLALSEEHRHSWEHLLEEEPDPGERDEPPRGSALAEWADQAVGGFDEPEDLDPEALALDGPTLPEPEPVIVYGGLAEGRPVAVRRPTGEVWIAELGIDWPWRRPERTAGGVAADLAAAVVAPMLDYAEPWAGRHTRSLRWLAPAVAAVILGVAAGLGVGLLVSGEWNLDAFVPTAALLGWAGYGVVFVAGFVAPEGAAFPNRDGVLLPGVWVDQVMAPSQVEQVVAGDLMIGVRLQADALSLHPDAIEAGASPARGAELLTRWLDEAQPRARGGMRPGPALAGLILFAVVAGATLVWVSQAGWTLA